MTLPLKRFHLAESTDRSTVFIDLLNATKLFKIATDIASC